MVLIKYLIISFVGALALIILAKGILAKILYREADYYDKQPNYDGTSPTGLRQDLDAEADSHSQVAAMTEAEAEDATVTEAEADAAAMTATESDYDSATAANYDFAAAAQAKKEGGFHD